ncbi:MAG: N-6 DNA methylase [Eubacterium sp.]|nr:N-6 DNA methylase [Eubacterium sp.]
MDKIREKLDALYKKYDFVSNKQEMTVFVIKVMVLKFLENRGLLSLDKKTERHLRERFTVETLMACWQGSDIGDDFWFSEDGVALSETIWADVMDMVREGESFAAVSPEVIGEIYEACLQRNHKKHQGIFYTPRVLADYMAGLCIDATRAQRVLDPACGGASLLGAVYDKIMAAAPEDKRAQKHQWLMQEGLWGIDMDPVAALVARLILVLKWDTYVYPKNIFVGDALVAGRERLGSEKFDVIIANPPYIGHKEVDADYMQGLKQRYGAVYKNKGDLSYCFFAMGLECIKAEGRMVYLTSRYFMEAYNARSLRETLAHRIKIERIVDFNGLRVIPGVGVDPAITLLVKGEDNDNGQIRVTRFYPTSGAPLPTEFYLKDMAQAQPVYCESFETDQAELKPEGWELYSPVRRGIISKIEARSPFVLKDLVDSFQGMITGNDKVFIFETEDAQSRGFSPELCHPWIKNKDVRAFVVAEPQKEILYTNGIRELADYPREKAYLEPFKAKLMERRECKKGKLPWYGIQWGRDPRAFRGTKIVFPYKAKSNRFAIDREGCFFSADIYGLTLKEVLYSQIGEETLVLLLNSSLYTYYFQSFAKKLGADLYEYYPNTLLKLRIPEIDRKTTGQFKDIYDKIILLIKSQDTAGCRALLEETDRWLYDYFKLTAAEIQAIEGSLSEH